MAKGQNAKKQTKKPKKDKKPKGVQVPTSN
jgi:hypothetical protein